MSDGGMQYLASLVTASTTSSLVGHWTCPTTDTGHWWPLLTSLASLLAANEADDDDINDEDDDDGAAAAADNDDDDDDDDDVASCLCSRRLFWNQMRTLDLSRRRPAESILRSWSVSSSNSVDDGVVSAAATTNGE